MSLRINYAPIRKVVAGALSSVSSVGVLTFLAASGVTLPEVWGGLIVAAAGTIAAYVWPDPKVDTTK